MQFRETTASDRERILALRARCFAEGDPEKHDPRFWDWQFANARFFIAEEHGELLSHLALVQLPHRIDGKLVPGMIGIDAMTAPSARGKGAFSGIVRLVTGEAGAVITSYQIRKRVLGPLLRNRWKVAGRVPILLRPAALWRGKREPFRTLTPDDVEWMSAFDEGTIARTPEFLRWRFFDNPYWRYDVKGVENAAYLVARRTTLRGIPTYAIADLGWRDEHIAKALLRDAVIEAREQRCLLTAALVSRDHPAYGWFLRRGFVPGPHRFNMVVHPPELASRRWRVMWADTDHL